MYAATQAHNVWTYEGVSLEGDPGPRAFIRPPPYVPFGVVWAGLDLD
ncbi:hypothetical protein [Deinococcus hopiensis]|uniref:Uncharacterized protein n=1 Tax=Deinococcus hopiensis KR-140 TaxID=695939 RepID=A0A1W1VBR8_9DEIO|nr:hypothetical protein [Deinococcus hopiensis]SMB90808.1 hypothetical protein SAMN00790413_00900 [Deinococcus hopiensis KR-140]